MKTLTRRGFVAGVGLAAAQTWMLGQSREVRAQAPDEASPPRDRRPNIVVFLADDLGYGDLGCHGSIDLRTPRIDALAAQGTRFLNAYSAAPVCGPSRAGLLSGQHPCRYGFEFNGVNELPTDLPLLPQVLRDAGYVTGIVGKWHLGEDAQRHPMRRGFDEFYGFLGGQHPYTATSPDRPLSQMRGFETTREDRYLTDAYAQESCDFVRRHRQRPFFLFVSFNAVHYPLQAPEQYLQRNTHIPTGAGRRAGRRRTYAAMVTAMDDAVGTVLDELDRAGLRDDTLVVFLSDNGGPTPEITASNAPLRGFKKDLWEGGVRVPMLARFPGKIAAGSDSTSVVSALDLLPTFAAAAGAALPATMSLDGLDLLAPSNGEDDRNSSRALCWRFGKQWAVRRGTWKLLRFQDEPWRLYDLANGPSELIDQARREPEQVAELAAIFTAWEARLQPPRWSREPAPLAQSRPWPAPSPGEAGNHDPNPTEP